MCRGERFCSSDFLVIPNGKCKKNAGMTFDRFCGQALNDGLAPAMTPASSVPITSSSTPFIVHFRTGSQNDGMDRGFRLSYRQNTC